MSKSEEIAMAALAVMGMHSLSCRCITCVKEIDRMTKEEAQDNEINSSDEEVERSQEVNK